MAALPVVPKTLKLAVSVLDDAGRQLLSRVFITYTGTAPTAGQLNTFCAAVATAWGSDLKSLVIPSRTLDLVEAVDLSSVTGASGFASPSTAGTRSGGELPADASMVISYEIVRRYRGGHARGYWCFGAATDLLDASNWSSTFLTAVGTGWAAFIAAVEAAGWSGAGTLTHSNISQYEGFDVVTDPITHRARNVPQVRVPPLIDTVTSYVYRPRIGSQRRRLRP